MGTPIWPIEGVAIDSTGDMVDGSLAQFISSLNADHLRIETVYPTLAAGISVVSANSDWTLGAFSEVVPVDTITDDFQVHVTNIESCDEDATIEMVLYHGAGDTEFDRSRFTITGGFFGNIQDRVSSPVISANSRIRAKIASSNGTAAVATITISIFYSIV